MKNKGIFSYVAGMFFSVLITFALILILSGVVQLFTLSQTVVKIVNQVIKIVAVLCGVFCCVRGRHGAPKGGAFGLVYALLVEVIFGLTLGGLSFDLSFLLDIVFGLAVGAICGIIAVNLAR